MLLAIPVAVLAGAGVVRVPVRPAAAPRIPVLRVRAWCRHRSARDGPPKRAPAGRHLGFILGFSVVFVLTGALFGGRRRRPADQRQRLITVIAWRHHHRPGRRLRRLAADAAAGGASTWSPGSACWASPLLGIVFGLGWTPCIGPALSVVLTLALNEGSAARGGILAFAYALGLGLPFLAFAVAFTAAGPTPASSWMKHQGAPAADRRRVDDGGGPGHGGRLVGLRSSRVLRQWAVDLRDHPVTDADRARRWRPVELLRWAWGQLTSMRTALMMLFLLALAAIPGSMIPQQSISPISVVDFKRANPVWDSIFEPLGLYDVYTSPCLLRRLSAAVRLARSGASCRGSGKYRTAVRKPPPSLPARIERLPATDRGTVEVPTRRGVRRRADGGCGPSATGSGASTTGCRPNAATSARPATSSSTSPWWRC